MKYFDKINTLDELKSRYRDLAMINHPDRGGDVKIMQEINVEFESMFGIFFRKDPTTPNDVETASNFRRKFYTENGWAGSRYDLKLSIKDITSITREYVKGKYSDWKFSVKKENDIAIQVTLMEAPVRVFKEEDNIIQNWDYQYYLISDEAIEVLRDVVDFVNSYRYNDSDAMYDHFDTNFYTHFDIGKWNKPLKIVQRKKKSSSLECQSS